MKIRLCKYEGRSLMTQIGWISLIIVIFWSLNKLLQISEIHSINAICDPFLPTYEGRSLMTRIKPISQIIANQRNPSNNSICDRLPYIMQKIFS